MTTRAELPRHQLGVAGMVAIVATIGASCLADIRPPTLMERGITQDSRQRAEAAIARMEEAHGGRSRWLKHGYARVTLTDHWPGALTRMMAMPWEDNGQRMELVVQLGADNARINFIGGPDDGKSWGLQQWRTYTTAGPQQDAEFRKDSDVWFWVPTLAYFFELPFRIGEATVLAHGGSRDLGGTQYDLIYATWGQDAPQGDVDQYVLWLNEGTGLLDYVEYTVRDMAPFVSGTMHYDEYQSVDGIMVPKVMDVVDVPGGSETVHRMEVEQVVFDGQVPAQYVVPRPDLRAEKLAKGG